MLTIRCAACSKKIWRYDKIGQGEVLRCHKDRINKMYKAVIDENGRVSCPCGKKTELTRGAITK